METKLNLNILKKTILVIKFLFFICFYSLAQDYTLNKTISINAKGVEVDRFGNIYTLEDYNITKFDSEGNVLFSIENIDLISNLDVSNPLKPVIFYKEINELQIFDQKFSLLNSISLLNKNFDYIDCISSSKGSNYLLFDKTDNKLKKVDKAFNVLYRSESFLNLFKLEKIIFKIIEQDNGIYILNKEGIDVFDSFLTYVKTIPIKDVANIQIFENEIIYLEDNNLLSYNVKTLQYKEMSIPKTDKILATQLVKNGLVVLSVDTLFLYSVK